jgi:hypothetical protein
MINVFIVNGRLQLVVSPSNEMEKMLLTQLAQDKVDIQLHPTLSVGERVYADCITLTPTVKE